MGSLAKKVKDAFKHPPMLCLVCGVDSGPIRNFLFLFIGTLVGATILLLIWAYLTNRLHDRPETAALALEAEKKEHEDV